MFPNHYCYSSARYKRRIIGKSRQSNTPFSNRKVSSRKLDLFYWRRVDYENKISKEENEIQNLLFLMVWVVVLWLTASSMRCMVLPIFVTFCDAQNRSNNCNSWISIHCIHFVFLDLEKTSSLQMWSVLDAISLCKIMHKHCKILFKMSKHSLKGN